MGTRKVGPKQVHHYETVKKPDKKSKKLSGMLVDRLTDAFTKKSHVEKHNWSRKIVNPKADAKASQAFQKTVAKKS